MKVFPTIKKLVVKIQFMNFDGRKTAVFKKNKTKKQEGYVWHITPSTLCCTCWLPIHPVRTDSFQQEQAALRSVCSSGWKSH